MTTRMTRREFVQRGALLVAAVPALRHAPARAATTLRIGVVDSTSDRRDDQRLGIELGVDEARHAAQLFGGTIEIVPLTTASPRDRSLTAIVGGADVDTCASWAAHAQALTIVYLNVGCTADDLRGTKCSRAAFHVVPSERMYRDAATLAGAQGGEAAAWHASLSRFGADTLNQRFRARFARPMTSESWAAWMAIKILWESTLRTKSSVGSLVASYLERDATQFDGHKGQPLSFRSWDHQLRQPVYVIRSDGASGRPAVREVPDVAADDSPRDALDRIGVGRSASSCRFGR